MLKDFLSKKHCDAAGAFKMGGSQDSIGHTANDPPRTGHELELFVNLLLE